MIEDDEDDDRLTRDEIAEQYLWQPGEREAHERELQQRQQRIDAEAREIKVRAGAHLGPCDGAGRPLHDPAYRLAPSILSTVVTKSHSAPVAAAAEPDWDAWKRFILSVVRKEFVSKKRFENELEAIGKIVCDWDLEVCQVTREKREDALAPLRAEIERLSAEIAELRALRSKPATDDEARQRAGDIRRARQKLAQLQVA